MFLIKNHIRLLYYLLIFKALFCVSILTNHILGYIIYGKRLCFCGNPVRESVSQAESTVGRVVRFGNTLFIKKPYLYKVDALFASMRVAPRTKIKLSSSRICFLTFPGVFYFLAPCFSALSVHRRKRDQLFKAVRLHLCVVCGSVSVYLTAFCAFIYYYIAFSRVGKC